ncbi:ribosome maturation factor RimM [Corynebacterium poyangense]|uniref:Ribosome maturation factor RimM n=1 Tax=Corynebacterium poyangense TaxID=2684405 RepID=A0A7H0SPK4_9CORY|nr:ribosome maturation factor RimM [Corynebacterium poyangense]QNQ90479.1 ribosome maturation factor RimM [Corynebacterium poyangense]
MELMIGRVIKSHGVRGEVAIEVTTDEPAQRFAVGQVLRGVQNNKEHQLTITAVRPHQGRLLVKFAEIKDRTSADSLRGTRFMAPPREPDDDGFYDHELEGLTVFHDGTQIGTITGVSHLPRNTLLEVELHTGKNCLIPFVHAIVPEVDVAAGKVAITPPDGLLEL